MEEWKVDKLKGCEVEKLVVVARTPVRRLVATDLLIGQDGFLQRVAIGRLLSGRGGTGVPPQRLCLEISAFLCDVVVVRTPVRRLVATDLLIGQDGFLQRVAIGRLPAGRD